MTVILEAIEIIAEDVAAHLGALPVEPPADEVDDFDNGDWWRNGPLAGDLLDLAEVVNQAAAIIDRPRVRRYLASAEFPRSRHLATLFAVPVVVVEPPALAVAPMVTPTVAPVEIERKVSPAVGAALRLAGMKPVESSEKAILALATGPAQITTSWLADEVGVRARNARRMIYQLEQRELIRQVRPPTPGRGIPATYALTDQFRAALAPIAEGCAQ